MLTGREAPGEEGDDMIRTDLELQQAIIYPEPTELSQARAAGQQGLSQGVRQCTVPARERARVGRGSFLAVEASDVVSPPSPPPGDEMPGR